MFIEILVIRSSIQFKTFSPFSDISFSFILLWRHNLAMTFIIIIQPKKVSDFYKVVTLSKVPLVLPDKVRANSQKDTAYDYPCHGAEGQGPTS